MIINGLALKEIKKIESNTIDCVITSPPYWQLRDYGFSEQWGLEPTFQEYLEHLWSLMDEIYRVLKPTGTVWINLGDTYSNNSKSSGEGEIRRTGLSDSTMLAQRRCAVKSGLPDKCLVLIPHRFAIGCIDRGWIVRNDIIWAKINGMPESVTDRFSKKHEYFFFMVKNQKYYFDLDGIRDSHKESSVKRWSQPNLENQLGSYTPSKQNGNMKAIKPKNVKHTKNYGNRELGGQVRDNHDIHDCYNPLGKNPGDVSDFWDIATKPNKADHFATFNTALIDKPIMAGCPEGGIILDPFAGTGTTLVRALQLNRKVIGIEGNEKYCKIAEANINRELQQVRLFDNV